MDVGAGIMQVQINIIKCNVRVWLPTLPSYTVPADEKKKNETNMKALMLKLE